MTCADRLPLERSPMGETVAGYERSPATGPIKSSTSIINPPWQRSGPLSQVVRESKEMAKLVLTPVFVCLPRFIFLLQQVALVARNYTKRMVRCQTVVKRNWG